MKGQPVSQSKVEEKLKQIGREKLEAERKKAEEEKAKEEAR